MTSPSAPAPESVRAARARPVSGRAASTRLLSPRVAVPVLAGLTALARLPFVGLAPSPDEGGLLMVAGQWRAGTSLYGDYWVDRPPLLIDVFAVAAHLGGPGVGGVVALRLLGLVLVAASVLLAGVVGRLAGGPTGGQAVGRPVAAAVVAAVLLCQPRLGTLQVDGELVAVPLVLAGFAAILAALQTRSARTAGRLLVVTGGCAAAALVKQNEVDVFVLVLAATARLPLRAPLPRRSAFRAVLVGAVGVTTVVVGGALLRGTSPSGLWDAVVAFRWHASRVIAADATPATTDRLHGLLLAALLAGLPLLLARWALSLRRRPNAGRLDLRVPTAAVLAWETVSVLAGGSYWHHYLICLVPGLVLAEAQQRRRATVGGVRIGALGALAALCAWPLALAYHGAAAGTAPDPAVTWLRDHAGPDDTGLVAYGGADILYGAGLRSPYPELWSLPVRVRDPDLRDLTAVLESARRPTWIVTGPRGDLDGWGLNALAAQAVFRVGYDEVADLGATRVFHVRDGT